MSHVAYGFPDLKIHAKMTLIVRREGDLLRRYAHIGTGNYHAATARSYEDLGVFTADEEITADVADLFNYITGFGRPQTFRKLLVAPFTLRSGLVDEIRTVASAAADGKHARIRLKLNHLVDPKIVEELYAASTAGATIDILARSTCALRPGVEGVSENIHVRSIVGRFLEHSRVYSFEADERVSTYIGSPDLMQRNLDHRIEVLMPVESARVRQEITRDPRQRPRGRRERVDPRSGRGVEAEHPGEVVQAALTPRDDDAALAEACPPQRARATHDRADLGDRLAVADGDARRRREVQRRGELGAAPLEHPGAALLARHVPAEELLERLAVSTDERRVREIVEEDPQIVDRGLGLELPAVLDHETATLGERDDGLDATRQRTRDDGRDLPVGEGPHELARDDAPAVVEPTEAVDARRREPPARARVSQQQHCTPPVAFPARARILGIDGAPVKGARRTRRSPISRSARYDPLRSLRAAGASGRRRPWRGRS